MQQRQMSQQHDERSTTAPQAIGSRAEIRPVCSRREREAFIRLPWRLYRGQANWVPPLLSERRRHIDRSRNPFFEHAEAEYFLAWRGASRWDASPPTSTIG